MPKWQTSLAFICSMRLLTQVMMTRLTSRWMRVNIWTPQLVPILITPIWCAGSSNFKSGGRSLIRRLEMKTWLNKNVSLKRKRLSEQSSSSSQLNQSRKGACLQMVMIKALSTQAVPNIWPLTRTSAREVTKNPNYSKRSSKSSKR